MAVLVRDLTDAGMIRERSLGGLRAEVYADFARVEALWRGLEADPGVLMTPYQRFDWVRAYLEAEFGTDARRQAEALRVVVVRDAFDRPRLLLPLRVSSAFGVRVARVVGEKHANVHMPLFASREAAAMEPEDLSEALRQAARVCGIDMFALNFQPRFWDGVFNPLGAAGFPCTSDAYGLLLGPDPDATLRRAYSGDARKKLRTKERKLVELLGPVEHRVAASPEAVAEVLQAFYAQKAARMVQMGTFDPYADARIRRFFALATEVGARALSAEVDAGSAKESSTKQGLGDAIRSNGIGCGSKQAPSMELHALVARESGRILATFGGAVDRDRFSGMWTSFDIDPALVRFSPGDILLHRLIGQQTAAGRRAFDLGVGEARYKANVCDERIEMVMTTIPVTLRGHLFAAGERCALLAKRRIKRSARLRGAWRRLYPRRAL